MLGGGGEETETARSLHSVFMSVLSRAGGGKKERNHNKKTTKCSLILLWMRAARCSSSFMLCRFHRGINTTLSQHPAQPHQPRCTASTADYLILCLLTHLSLPATTAAEVGRGLSGDVMHPLSAIPEVLHHTSAAFQPAKVGEKKHNNELEEKPSRRRISRKSAN